MPRRVTDRARQSGDDAPAPPFAVRASRIVAISCARCAGLLGVLLLLNACTEGTGRSERAAREVRVSAAASLADAFADIERAFEEAHPDLDVVLNVAASSTLREQILGGAPADVFASANAANMEAAAAAGVVAGAPSVFARNRLRIAVPAGNPATVRGLGDLANPELLIGLCAPGVPCGDYAAEVLARSGVPADVDTYEPNARALLAKIEAGELDAGIVYATDVTSSDRVVALEPETLLDEAVVDYPIAILTGAANRRGADRFVAFVLSDAGQAILRRHGFTTP